MDQRDARLTPLILGEKRPRLPGDGDHDRNPPGRCHQAQLTWSKGQIYGHFKLSPDDPRGVLPHWALLRHQAPGVWVVDLPQGTCSSPLPQRLHGCAGGVALLHFTAVTTAPGRCVPASGGPGNTSQSARSSKDPVAGPSRRCFYIRLGGRLINSGRRASGYSRLTELVELTGLFRSSNTLMGLGGVPARAPETFLGMLGIHGTNEAKPRNALQLRPSCVAVGGRVGGGGSTGRVTGKLDDFSPRADQDPDRHRSQHRGAVNKKRAGRPALIIGGNLHEGGLERNGPRFWAGQPRKLKGPTAQGPSLEGLVVADRRLARAATA